MPNRTALAAILALSIVLAACGGSAEEPTGGEVSETSAPTTTFAPTTTTTEPPPVEPALTADATEEAAPTADEPLDMVEHLREKTMHLWDVYNTHDPDALKILYSDTYWEEEKEASGQTCSPS